MFTSPSSSRRRRRGAFAAACAAAVVLSGCMANPGDAPTVEGEDPPAPAEDPGDARSLREIRVGVDEFGDGFNPHLIGDVSPVTDLVASLTLPSAFEPDPENPDKWRMSPDLLESAELVPVTDPVPREDAGAAGDGRSGDGTADDGAPADSSRTVAPEIDPGAARPGDTRIRYRINPGAQWSDGTPISGSDFRYLHSVLTDNAGVVDAAGYERIRGITVSDGGRQVDVIVAGELPEWRSLFRYLLPSHILRPSTTAFADALDAGIPASGGRYRAEAIDVGRGEVRLVRNDRFWGETPALTENVTVRSVPDAVTGAELLRSGQFQALRLRPKQTTGLTYGMVPGAVEVPSAVPRELVLHANVASPLLSDAGARRSVFSAIDVASVAAVATGRTDDLDIPGSGAGSAPDAGSGERSGGSGADSDSGQRPTALSRELSDAGVRVTEDDPLRIGVMGEDTQALAAARAVSDQLQSAGVPAVVERASDQDLARALLPHGRVDLTVAWDSRVTSPLHAQSRWGCPASSRPSLPADSVPGESSRTSATTSAPTAPANRGTPGVRPSARDGAAPASVARAANLSGVCDERIDELLDDAEGTGHPGPEIDAPEGDIGRIRARVDELAIELPIVGERVLTVIGPGVRYGGMEDPEQWPRAPYTGPLRTLPEWRRLPETAPANGGGTAGDAAGE